jgi:uncharacterized protein YdhG (YjbR/CyaY superfamily)
MTPLPRCDSHESVFRSLPPDTRERLMAIRDVVVARVPGATPCIAYNMPAFRQGRVFFYFAAFQRHIGVYPPVTQDEDLAAELAPYRGPKGNLSFAHSEPLPLELIGRVAQALARQYGGE